MARDVNHKRMVAVLDESWKKYRAFKTVSLFVAFFCLGLSCLLLGPTLVSMEVLLNTDTEHISATFTGAALGYLVGAILCGLIYSKLNKELLFAFSLIGIGVTVAYAPFSPNLIVFIVINGCQNLFMGIIDTAGQSYLLRLWQDHRYRKPLMQCLHGVWSGGATVAPFIAHGFLVDIPGDVDDLNGYNETTPTLNYTVDFNVTEEETLSSASPDVELVRIPYLIVASIVAASSTLFFVIFFLMGSSCLDPSRALRRRGDDETVVKLSKRYKKLYACFLAILFVFFFVQIWLEGIPSSLVAVFVVKGLGWPNEKGALVTSTYMAFHGLSRLIAIPLAAILSPRSMLISDMALVAAGYALLLFADFHPFVPWIAVALSGLGIGSAFPSGILWAEGFIEVTSTASSVFVTAMSTGALFGPALTGFLMGDFTHMCFAYVLIVAEFLLVATYITVVLFAKRVGLRNRSPRTCKERSVKATSKEITKLNPNNSQDKSSPVSQADENIAEITKLQS